jgi:hypothetical protein
MIVKKIFFSKNERFLVLITENQAITVEVEKTQFKIIAQIDLPSVSYAENNPELNSPRSNFDSYQVSPRSDYESDKGLKIDSPREVTSQSDHDSEESDGEERII